MKLTLRREWPTDNTTPGQLYVNGAWECFTLEDKLRAPGVKIKGQTAIAAGKYQVAINHSSRFGRLMPLLVNVPMFEGIRIHSGNTAANTEGCILVGAGRATNNQSISESRKAYHRLYEKLAAAVTKEKIEIEIINPPGWDAQFAQKQPAAQPKQTRVIPMTPAPEKANVAEIDIQEALRSQSWAVTVPSSAVVSPSPTSVGAMTSPAAIGPGTQPRAAEAVKQSVKQGNTLPSLLALLAAARDFLTANRYVIVCVIVAALLLVAYFEIRPQKGRTV